MKHVCVPVRSMEVSRTRCSTDLILYQFPSHAQNRICKLLLCNADQQTDQVFLCAGRQYDQFGSAVDWWSATTSSKFEERAQCFVDQYSSYTVSELNRTVSPL